MMEKDIRLQEDHYIINESLWCGTKTTLSLNTILLGANPNGGC